MNIDEEIIRILILLHAIAGGISLLSGSMALIFKKGSKPHRISGWFFYSAMLLGCSLALVISNCANHQNFFLFIIGVFSLYMILTGIQYLQAKRILQQKVFSFFGLLSAIMLFFVICFFYLGIGQIIGNKLLPYFPQLSSPSKGIIMIVFGFFGTLFLRDDVRWFRGKETEGSFWLASHLTRMTAAYISAFTAFLVVNNKILPGIIAWLLPSAIGVPVIIYHRNKLMKK